MSHKTKHGGGGGHGGGASSERWLLTYADLITLLMVFFIVMYAMSQLDKTKYSAMAQGLHSAFGGGNLIVPTGMGTGDGVSVPMPRDLEAKILAAAASAGAGGGGSPQADPLQGIGRDLLGDFTRDGRFTVRIAERGLVISLVGSAAFDSGKADIKPEFHPLLSAVVEKLRGIPNDVSVEGFTDSDPIHTGEFPSNWHLSVARANQVRDYLEDRGIAADRLIVVGYGETRPAWSNLTPEGKAKNRRVDVVVLRNKQVIDLGQEINGR